MKRRNFLIGLVIIALLAGLVFLLRRPKEPLEVPEATPSVEERMEETFKFEIPEDVEKAELKDVTGGTSVGFATRKFEQGRFTHSVLADLPDPEGDLFYEAWLVRGSPGDPNFALISTGKMRLAKGGYVLDFESTTDYRDYQNVVITLEEVFDNNPEEHILEGSF